MISDPCGTSGVTDLDKTASAILGAAILAVAGAIVLPSAATFFLLMFVFIAIGSVADRIRRR
jgi:hypothetical protein